MAQRHPDNAEYVSGDGLVSFDMYGRKLDSNGNVAWGDRQTVSGAGGRRLERSAPPPPPPVKVVYDPLASANTGLPSQFSPPARATSTPAAAPGTLLTGGIDPATGLPVPTFSNGGLRPPPPNSTVYARPTSAAVAPPQQPRGDLMTGGWRPGLGDMALPSQSFTYSDPFAAQRAGLPNGEPIVTGGPQNRSLFIPTFGFAAQPPAQANVGPQWRSNYGQQMYQMATGGYAPPPGQNDPTAAVYGNYGFSPQGQPYNPFSVESVAAPPPTRSYSPVGQPPPYWAIP